MSIIGDSNTVIRQKAIENGCASIAGCMVDVAAAELQQGLDFVKDYPGFVTIFGSARTPETDRYYEAARELSRRIAIEKHVPVATGGGPGIMEAGNRGAHEAGGNSFGMTIRLPHEQKTNPYVTHEIQFEYFFTRKTVMMFAAQAFVVFPGGYGTLDELFGLLTLEQTGEATKTPIYLYDSTFWTPLADFIRAHLEKMKYINDIDVNQFVITDSIDVILSGIKAFTH